MNTSRVWGFFIYNQVFVYTSVLAGRGCTMQGSAAPPRAARLTAASRCSVPSSSPADRKPSWLRMRSCISCHNPPFCTLADKHTCRHFCLQTAMKQLGEKRFPISENQGCVRSSCRNCSLGLPYPWADFLL